jgi:hypothetical protein
MEQGRLATVPKVDGAEPGEDHGTRARLKELIALGPVAIVVAGLGFTAAWIAFLAWCLFALIRWAVG